MLHDFNASWWISRNLLVFARELSKHMRDHEIVTAVTQCSRCVTHVIFTVKVKSTSGFFLISWVKQIVKINYSVVENQIELIKRE